MNELQRALMRVRMEQDLRNARISLDIANNLEIIRIARKELMYDR